MRKELLIYNGPGVSEFFLPHLKNEFGSFFNIGFIDADNILDEKWIKAANSILIPGGRDVYYHQELKGVRNAQIQKFVKNGGNYIGICAGAYYASSYIEFAKGTPLEIVDERHLKFTDAIATGPVLGFDFSYDNNKTARNVEIFYQSQTMNLTLNAYYNGGCTFKGSNDYRPLAFYDLEKKMPAIILKNYGKGKVLLSGVHIECPSINEKKHQQVKRQKLIADIFKHLCHIH